MFGLDCNILIPSGISVAIIPDGEREMNESCEGEAIKIKNLFFFLWDDFFFVGIKCLPI